MNVGSRWLWALSACALFACEELEIPAGPSADGGAAAADDGSTGRDPVDSGSYDPVDDAGADVADAGALDGAVDIHVPLSDAGNNQDAANPSSDAAARDAGDSGGSRDSGASPPPICPVFYRDADADGYGDPTVFLRSCTQPDGYVPNAGDCYDRNALAKPGQTGWLAAQRGDGSFDYDCDGAANLMYPKFAECPELDDSCPPPNQWSAGFSCDYDAMMAGLRASGMNEGWSHYATLACTSQPCPEPVWTTIPSCGAVGEWGNGLIWDDAKTSYECYPGILSTHKMQLCH